MAKAKTQKTGTPAEASTQPTETKLSKVATGQLIQWATGQGRHRASDLTPGVLAELSQAGMLVQITPPIGKDQTIEAQVARNRRALAALAHWAKNACPKDPFKGVPGGDSYGYTTGRATVYHPARTAWDSIKKPQEYKSCPRTEISERGWDYLAGLGIAKPAEGDKGKPCAN